MAIIYNNRKLCSFLQLPVLWKVITFKSVRLEESTIKYTFSYLPLNMTTEIDVIETICGFLVPEYYHPFNSTAVSIHSLGTNFFEVNIPLPCCPLVGDLSSPLILMIIVFTWCCSLVEVFLSLSLAKGRAMILLQLSIFLTGWFQVRVRVFFLVAGCHSQRCLSWLSKDHPSQHLQLARESGSFLRTQGVAGSAAEMVLHQWAQHQWSYIVVNPVKDTGRPGLSCVKPSWFSRRLPRSAAPETGDTSSLSLSCISVMLLARVLWLHSQHTFFSSVSPCYLLPCKNPSMLLIVTVLIKSRTLESSRTATALWHSS